MSDIAPPYLPCRARIGHLFTRAVARRRREAMSTYEHPIAVAVWSAGPSSSGLARAEALALEAVQTLSAMARDALFAYAITGSAVASLAIIAAPHLEMLLRCAFHGRG
jgi:hypothetical protein